MSRHDIIEHWNISEVYYKGGSSCASGSNHIKFNLSVTLKDCDCPECLEAKVWMRLALMGIQEGCQRRMFGKGRE
jgi:hypothetical protein